MQTNPKDKFSYLLRLWRSVKLADPAWHVSLEDPMTGERKGFAGIEELADFLKSVTHTLDDETELKEEHRTEEE